MVESPAKKQVYKFRGHRTYPLAIGITLLTFFFINSLSYFLGSGSDSVIVIEQATVSTLSRSLGEDKVTRFQGSNEGYIQKGGKQEEERYERWLSQLINQGQVNFPAKFDWEAYTMYSPALGLTSSQAAKMHFAQYGKLEGRPYTRLRVIMRYVACGGLVNQLYSHIAAFALARRLGAEIVLPPAIQRSSFQDNNIGKDRELLWAGFPIDGLLDVDSIISYWASRGLVVHPTFGYWGPMPKQVGDTVGIYEVPVRWMSRWHHKPPNNLPGYPADGHARLMDAVRSKLLRVGQLVDRCKTTIVKQATAYNRKNPSQPLETVVLDLGCTYLMLDNRDIHPIVQEIVASLRFAPVVSQLAYKVVDGMLAQLGLQDNFNGLHLRLEGDVSAWSSQFRSQGVLHAYIDQMKLAGFSRERSVYIATGLLTYGNRKQFDDVVTMMQQNSLCGAVYYKDLFLQPEELQQLNSEQKGLVDLLVLQKAQAFVGLGYSSFSQFTRQWLLLQGRQATQLRMAGDIPGQFSRASLIDVTQSREDSQTVDDFYAFYPPPFGPKHSTWEV